MNELKSLYTSLKEKEYSTVNNGIYLSEGLYLMPNGSVLDIENTLVML